MMIRAGKRDEVLTSSSMWMCTSCYNCVARCPRGLPITHIMHGLANYAHRLGIAPKNQATQKFAKLFWDNLTKTGRINELRLGISLYFMNGLVSGMKMGMMMAPLGQRMMQSKRLSPMEYFGGHKCKKSGDLKKILAKAREIEDAKMQKFDV